MCQIAVCPSDTNWCLRRALQTAKRLKSGRLRKLRVHGTGAAYGNVLGDAVEFIAGPAAANRSRRRALGNESHVALSAPHIYEGDPESGFDPRANRHHHFAGGNARRVAGAIRVRVGASPTRRRDRRRKSRLIGAPRGGA